MIPYRFRPLTTGKVNRAATEAAVRFLSDLWDYEASAFTFIVTRRNGRWREHAIKGDRLPKIGEIIAAHPADLFDIYFCPNAFSGTHRRSALAMPTRYAWCDIDAADPDAYEPSPNILWETSPSRFQAIWKWREYSPGDIAQQISRNILAKDGGDKTGWPVNKLLRLPGTINHKPEYNNPVVTLQVCDERPQKPPRSLLDFEPPTPPAEVGTIDIEGIDPREVMRRFRRPMGLAAGTLMTAERVMRTDRSGAVFAIVMGMIEAGAEDAEIAAVLLVNPYFTSKWGTSLDKAKEQIIAGRTRAGKSR